MSLAVAGQYGKALLDVVSAKESGLPAEDALVQLKQFREMFGSSSELREVMLSPAVDLQKKVAVVSRLAEMSGIHPLLRNFLLVVTKKQRLGVLPEILESFQAQLDAKLGIVRPLITAAHDLSESLRLSLDKELERITGSTVRSEHRVDPSLIGGVNVQVGSKRYDGSVRGQLQGLRQRLSGHA